jgi:hypothetical protein
MPAIRIVFSVLLAIIGVASAFLFLGEAYRTAKILYSYQEVEGVVVAVRNGQVLVNYTRPDGFTQSMRAPNRKSRYVGKAMTVLLPPAELHDDALPVLEDDLTVVMSLLLITMCFLIGATLVWPSKDDALPRASSKILFVGHSRELVKLDEREIERQQRLQASIDLEIEERHVEKQVLSPSGSDSKC